MLKSFKTEINPTDKQKVMINKTIGTCRFVYNFYIAHNKEIYSLEKRFVSGYDFQKWLNNTYLKEHPEVKKYAILDDEIFGDYNELMDHLVKTNFFNNGLESYHVNQIVNLLGKKEDD